MQDKRRRILNAAMTLFETEGFAAVTTQAISSRADIGVGTLFRYAASKTELLMVVYNEKLCDAFDLGIAAARGLNDPTEAILHMVSPLLALTDASGENGTIYQRELLFGTSDDPHRLAGLALIAEFEATMAGRLCELAARAGYAVDENAARLASSSIFAVTHLAASRKTTKAHADYAPIDDLRSQISQIITGHFANLKAAPLSQTTGRRRNSDD